MRNAKKNNKAGEENREQLYLSAEAVLEKLSTETFLMKLYLNRDLNYLRDEPCEDLGCEN